MLLAFSSRGASQPLSRGVVPDPEGSEQEEDDHSTVTASCPLEGLLRTEKQKREWPKSQTKRRQFASSLKGHFPYYECIGCMAGPGGASQ